MTQPSTADDTLRERWFFLGSALVLAMAVGVGLAREQHWGQQMVPFQLTSRDATGLRPGQEVRISGMRVGQVRSLQLRPDASVAVEVRVAKRYANLVGPASVARQGQEGLVGDRFLVITADPQPAGHAASRHGQRLVYEQPPELAELIQQLVQTQQDLQATLRNTTRLTASDLPQTLRDARRSLDGVRDLTVALQRESAATAPDLRATLQQLSRTGRNAEAASNQAQELLQTSQPVLLHTLDDIREVTRTSQRLLQGLMGMTGLEQAPKPGAEPATIDSNNPAHPR